MNPKDGLRTDQDLDGDRIPDDADTAEAIKDVLDAFKTRDAGKAMNPGGIGAAPDEDDRD